MRKMPSIFTNFNTPKPQTDKEETQIDRATKPDVLNPPLPIAIHDITTRSYMYGDNVTLPIVVDKLINVSGRINYTGMMVQLAIYNPTARIIKIGLNNALTDEYEYIINAQKLVVLPPFKFNSIYYLQETYTAGRINPTLYAYNCIMLTPVVNTIT
jgi:hypothetical protein